MSGNRPAKQRKQLKKKLGEDNKKIKKAQYKKRRDKRREEANALN